MRQPVSSDFQDVSQSRVSNYFRCPKNYYHTYINKAKKRTNYPMFLGTAVHRHIQFMHNNGNSTNPLFYKSVNTAIGAFAGEKDGRWSRMLEEEAEVEGLVNVNDEDNESFKKLGIVCIANYWKQMYGKKAPLEVEKRLDAKVVEYRIKLLGDIDQIREIPLKHAGAWNKDAVDQSGKLVDGYLPYVLIDLKTGGNSYTPNGATEEAKESDSFIKKMARSQYPLHQNIQATIYTYLFEKKYGALPLAFAFYYLRAGECWITHRTKKDYPDMFEKINHLLVNLEVDSFPRRENEKNCRNCLNFERCSSYKDLVVVKPIENTRILGEAEILVEAEEQVKPKQIKLPMRVPRMKRG